MQKDDKNKHNGGYTPMTKEELKKARTVLNIILTVVAIGVVIFVYFSKKG